MTQHATLADLRQQIDAIDGQIVALLSERAHLALQIGNAKQHRAIHDPVREQQVLDTVVAMNNGLLPDDAVRSIFKEVITACRNLQQR